MTDHRFLDRIQVGRWGNLLTLAGLSAGFVLVSTLATQVFVVTGVFRFDPAIGLVIPFSIAFGWIGIAASVAGVAIRDGMHVGLDEVTLLVGVAHVATGIVAMQLADHVLAEIKNKNARTVARWVGGFVLLAVVGGAIAGTMIGVGGELLGFGPTYLAPFIAMQYTIATIAIGVPLVWISQLIHVGRSDPSRRPDRSRFVPMVTVVALGWLVVASVGSLGFYNLQRIPTWALYDAGLGALTILADPTLFGEGAVRVQAVLAGVALATIVLCIVMDRRDGRQQT